MEYYRWGTNIHLDGTGRFIIGDLGYYNSDTFEEERRSNQSIDLNMYLHNNDGVFEWNWPGIGFHATAKDIRLEGRKNNGYDYVYGVWVHAKLQNTAGDWKDAEFELENFKNVDGNFEVLLFLPNAMYKHLHDQWVSDHNENEPTTLTTWWWIRREELRRRRLARSNRWPWVWLGGPPEEPDPDDQSLNYSRKRMEQIIETFKGTGFV